VGATHPPKPTTGNKKQHSPKKENKDPDNKHANQSFAECFPDSSET